MDASNTLKPALARGELHCVGATALDEYRKYHREGRGLAQRFQPVFVSRARGGRHDPRSCAASKKNMKFITACASPTRPLWRRRHVQPLPPTTATQPGHPFDGRGRFAPSHVGRFQAGEAGRAGPAHHAAQDRTRSLEEEPTRRRWTIKTLEHDLGALEADASPPPNGASFCRRCPEPEEKLDAARQEVEVAQRKGDFARATNSTMARFRPWKNRSPRSTNRTAPP